MKYLLIALLSISYSFAGDLNLICEDENFDPVESTVISTDDVGNMSAVVEFTKDDKSYRIAFINSKYHVEILDLISSKLTTLDIIATGELKELGQIDFFKCMILD